MNFLFRKRQKKERIITKIYKLKVFYLVIFLSKYTTKVRGKDFFHITFCSDLMCNRDIKG